MGPDINCVSSIIISLVHVIYTQNYSNKNCIPWHNSNILVFTRLHGISKGPIPILRGKSVNSVMFCFHKILLYLDGFPIIHAGTMYSCIVAYITIINNNIILLSYLECWLLLT